jgi:hypothetical protein
MSIPGFTAAAALSKVGEPHRMVGNFDRARGVIHPAQIPNPDGVPSLPIPDLHDFPLLCYRVCDFFCSPRLGGCHLFCHRRCL